MTPSVRALGVAATLLSVFSTVSPAQSRQKLSVELSGSLLYSPLKDPGFDFTHRLGYEAQARYTFSRLSLGVGYQRSKSFVYPATPNTWLELSFGFVEPRLVLAVGDRTAGYASGRLGFGKLICSVECVPGKTVATYGAGGGVLVVLSRRVSADLGGQVFGVSGEFTRGFVMLRGGFAVGL